jgi:hypothetical protein
VLANEVLDMAKQPHNHRAEWTRQEVKELRQLAKQNTPTRVIGLKLGRTPASIHNKATREGISLKPINQSPYGRRS